VRNVPPLDWTSCVFPEGFFFLPPSPHPSVLSCCSSAGVLAPLSLSTSSPPKRTPTARQFDLFFFPLFNLPNRLRFTSKKLGQEMSCSREIFDSFHPPSPPDRKQHFANGFSLPISLFGYSLKRALTRPCGHHYFSRGSAVRSWVIPPPRILFLFSLPTFLIVHVGNKIFPGEVRLSHSPFSGRSRSLFHPGVLEHLPLLSQDATILPLYSPYGVLGFFYRAPPTKLIFLRPLSQLRPPHCSPHFVIVSSPRCRHC